MKIAIVGTSHLTDKEKARAANAIESIFNENPDAEIITGDANGIDALVLSYSGCREMTMIKALDKKWEGKYGFKQRNIAIAEQADIIYSIAIPIKTTRCYHCSNEDHERTGGCWTKRYAIDKLDKRGRTIII